MNRAENPGLAGSQKSLGLPVNRLASGPSVLLLHKAQNGSDTKDP